MAVEVQVENHPGCVLFRLAGDVRLWNHLGEEDAILGGFSELLETAPPQLVLSLRKVHQIDSRGISVLVRIMTELFRKKIPLTVVLPAGVPGEALRHARVLDVCPRFHEEDEALRSANPALAS